MPIDPRQIEVIDEATADAMRRVPGPDRVAMIDAMWTSACRMAEARLREHRPDWTPQRLRDEAARTVAGAPD